MPKTQTEHALQARNGSRCPVCDADDNDLSFDMVTLEGLYAIALGNRAR